MIPASTAVLPSAGETPRSRPVAHLLAAGRDQAVVAGGQVVAGLGNLMFIAAAARVLPDRGFGHLAAFVALLTVLHLPGAALAATGVTAPHRAQYLLRRGAAAGALVGIVVAVLCIPLSGLLGLPVPFVLALAVAAPAAPVLGLGRGIAYATSDHRAVVASLWAEPAARLGLGLGLGLAAGAAGAAWGAAAGGWLALLALRRATTQPVVAAATLRRSGSVATSLAFLSLAVLQHQDLVIANRVLSARDVGAFAALSTLGGLVAFATATMPYVLLPAASRDGNQRGASTIAVGAAAAVAVGSVLVALVASKALVTLAVGSRYAHVAPLVPPYLGAMGALGLARVLAAHRCAQGAGRLAARRVGGIAIAHALTITAFARTPGQVVAVSGLALVATAGVLALPVGWDPQAPRRSWRAHIADVWRRPDAQLLVALTVLAVLVRLATERSFWVDEAISVRQARLPLGSMLDDLRTTDVHPPLHFLILWVSVRLLGTAEWAVRLPSVLAGAALVSVLYGTTRELFDRRTARVAAALVVPAPFLVWYSQEARMYALFMVLGVAAVWAQAAALRRGRWAAFATWGAASAALIWTQWFAFLPLLVQQAATVAYLLSRWRSGRVDPLLVRRWLGSLAVMAVLLVPLVPFLLDQLAAYGHRGAGLSMPTAAGTDSSSVASGLSSYAIIANLVWAVAGYHGDDVMVRLGALWPLAVLGCLLLLGRKMQRTTSVVLSVALVPGALLFVIAHSKTDLFELRYFVLAAPLLLIVIARAVTTGARSTTALAATVSALLVLSSIALVDQQVNGTNPRLYDFRGAVSGIHETSQPGDVLAYAPAYLDGVLAYYAPEMEGTPLGSVDPAAIDGQIYVVVAERFLTKESAGRIGDVLARLEQARGAPQRFERPNVMVWRFQ
jgi:O-antigen/teichoic acid export membrane protein